jgi:hypothetical protein
MKKLTRKELLTLLERVRTADWWPHGESCDCDSAEDGDDTQCSIIADIDDVLTAELPDDDAVTP